MRELAPPLNFQPKYTRRGSINGARARESLYAHVVDGKLMTTRQIAEAIGLSPDGAIKRIKATPHPLTMDKIMRRTA